MTAELDAVAELLALLLLDPRTGVLIALLVLAAWQDARSGRIANELVFSGVAIALAYGALSPAADGGLLWALAGLAVGLVLLLPFYVFGVMGAGDVKLMAMVGAFVGFPSALWAVLATFLAGGLLSLAVAMRKRSLRQMLANVATIARNAAFGIGLHARDPSAGSLPYGLAVAGGTIAYLVGRQLGLLA